MTVSEKIAQLLDRFKDVTGKNGFNGKQYSMEFVYALAALILKYETKAVDCAVDEAFEIARMEHIRLMLGGEVESEAQ